MICSACGTDNASGRKFCRQCGERLAVACPACGAANASDDRFCGECGVAISAAQPHQRPLAVPFEPNPAEAAAGTERRLVSVLFADLVGSTSFAEGRDPEDFRAMLSEYFDTASQAVSRHGGTVEKFIGDAVMAVWGTPTAHEDDAERAVRAAMDIVDRVEALGTRLGLPLRARVGVLTGEAVAAVGAVGQGIVAGDLVNTAARLQSAAEPGTVLVGERTYRAAAEAIAFTQVGFLALKGKQAAVPAWRAMRVIGEVGGSLRGSAPEPPFVGRDEELRLAKDLLHLTGRESRPRLLSVTGVAGIGKSRLVWELRKYVDGLTERVFWHQGRTPSYGEGIAFWALAEMVRGRAGIAETDDEDASRRRLHDCLADLIGDNDERHWLEPRLGHLLGLDPAPPGGRDELFGAWRRFIERVADQGTAVLVFEDLQWADPGLLDFVESLLAWSKSSPVLVITLARPELSERRPTWGASVRAFHSLHLDPLSAEDMTALVTGHVEGLPPEDVRRLVGRAEGIPLYAVETVRMLADRKFLEQVGPSYRVLSNLGGSLEVPETLHALVAARLDGLSGAERALVMDAAVAGHSFTLDAVCAVSGRPPEEVEPQLLTLVTKEVFDRDVDPRSAERGQFRFVQSVIQEVAYSTLSKAARRAKHLACAHWFAALDEDDLSGVVATHFLEAYRAEPSAADAEQVAGQARQWLRRAADRAFSLGSPEAAHGHAVQALTLASTPEERAPLHATAARGALRAGQGDLAWEQFIAACEAYQLIGDAEAEGRLLAEARRYPIRGVPSAELQARLEDVERRLETPGPANVIVQAALADGASADGRHDDALRWSERALVLAQSMPDDEALGAAAAARSWALFNADRQFEAVLLAEGVMSLADRSGSVGSQTVAAMHLGVFLSTSDPRRAMTVFLDASARADRGGIRPAQAMGLANAAEAAIDLGELDVAAHALAEAREIGGATGNEEDGVALSEALLLAYRGDTAAAWSILQRLDTERRPGWEHVQMTTWFLRTRSVVSLLDGDASAALGDARESIRLEASGGNASSSLWQGVQAAARLRDADALADLLATTAGQRGSWVDNVRATAEAALAALRGQTEDAAPAMRAALAAWSERDLPLDHAFTVAIALAVLPAGLAPQAEVDSALGYLHGLRAEGVLRLFTAPGRDTL